MAVALLVILSTAAPTLAIRCQCRRASSTETTRDGANQEFVPSNHRTHVLVTLARFSGARNHQS